MVNYKEEILKKTKKVDIVSKSSLKEELKQYILEEVIYVYQKKFKDKQISIKNKDFYI